MSGDNHADPRVLGTRGRFAIRFAISIAVAAGLGWFVWQSVDPTDLAALLANVSLGWVAAALVAFLAYQVVRAVRLKLVLSEPTSVPAMTGTMCVHGLANAMLPAGMGEVVLVYLLRRRHGIRLAVGAGLQVLMRLFDMAVFVAAFALLLAIDYDRIPGEVTSVMAALAMLTLLALAALYALARIGRRWEGAPAGRFPRLRAAIEAFLGAVREALHTRRVAPVLGATMVLWVLMYVYWLAVLRALGFDLSLEQILWIYLLFFAVDVLPVKGIASVGTHHLAWQLTLQLVGVPLAQAAAGAFGAHLIMLTITLVVGAPMLLALILRPTPAAPGGPSLSLDGRVGGTTSPAQELKL